MAKLNWFLTLKNMSKSDETAKTLLNSINNAESDELKEKAKMEAKEYVESFSEPEMPEESVSEQKIEETIVNVEPEHIDTESEVKKTEKELTIEIDTESENKDEERSEIKLPANSSVIERIRRRKQLAEEAVKKRQNQPTTLKEQKERAKERGRLQIERNRLMMERRAELRKKIEQQREEARKNNAKNMVGLLTILLRELKLNYRLEVICKNHGFTRKDIETLQENNPSGWAQCLAERPKLQKEMDMYIK